jgi:soluble lytic murein transglycosylase-like protein
MCRKLCIALFFVAVAAFSLMAGFDRQANAGDSELDAMISRHAAANNLPEALVRRVIKRESGGNPRLISAGNYGLMQIRIGTARAMGYSGSAAGLLDAETNMTYAVKYLAGAYAVAGGNQDRAVHYYAAGYYYAAKGRSLPNKTDSKKAIDAFAGAPAHDSQHESESNTR